MKLHDDLPKTFTLMSQRDHFKMLWKAQCFTSFEIARRLRITRVQLFDLIYEVEQAGELDPPLPPHTPCTCTQS